MKLNFIRLHNFRNIEFADIQLDDNSIWIFGKNAQGKTNLLEAIGLLNAIRSFRTTSTEALIRQGQSEAQILAQVQTQKFGEVEIQLNMGANKEIFVDSQKLTKLGEYLGKFPVLAITNEDTKLLRGSPEVRRKDMDMFISSLDKTYFESLRHYHKALSQRNSLLRAQSNDFSLYNAFEQEMAQSAQVILKHRKEKLKQLGNIASNKYQILVDQNPEQAEINLKPNCDISSADEFLDVLQHNRKSDLEKRSTQKGIHRDDFKIFIDNKDAKLYASEGQQKSAVIAIRLAQFDMICTYLQESPVIICDDILGELDVDRKSRFWQCIDTKTQVIATATELPSENFLRTWKTINVNSGTFK